MPNLIGQIIFLKVRRIIQLCICLLFLIIILTYYVRWSSRSNNQIQFYENAFDNPFLPQNAFYKKKSNDIVAEQTSYGRSDLAKYIHLDLKGAPPKANKFYESFFYFLEKLQMGIKGVLIEYEDMLPLQGNLVNISHRAAYTKSDIALIQDAAKKHRIEIIPLIQTFGHLEWILKLERFKSYRDDLNLPMVISPCLNNTYILLEDLLQQTLDMHPDSNIIHIGCDEVILKYSNSACPETDMSISAIYINHIRRVVDIVRKIRPGIRILVWDDILRIDQFINNQNLLNQLKGLVEPVSWNYFPTFNNQYKSSRAWKIYPKFFMNNWIASAFKGGLHRFSMITNTTHHVLNNREWLHFIASSNFRKESFSAIILTGWSRFDHFMPLCDLLPTAYPSLIYSLYMLNTDKFLVDDSIHSCEVLLRSVHRDAQLCESLPGLSIWSGISSLSMLLRKIQNRLKILNTIAPEYNRKHLFVRRSELHSRLSELRFLLKDLLSVKKTLDRRFMELYTEDVIDEWFGLYLTPTANEIDKTFAEFLPVDNKTSWERRPLI
ncbi:unnamed protein product [Rotaria sp. Silwood1]|nr:unnamed protein product [Rotaria sp. Silwood1]CAF3560147.1 unnamed protein product [Rotaria sp. Silwood1]CAF3562731.1 unnamed protein product [Rotaria sp. Silwood1]CAF4504791.1 unnamed protein product [Rotaria sp. Silwood1]CAF4582691.1 unnamed protein product [Rotaria sp. Silwood1]